MADEVRRGATESAELTGTSLTDDDKTGTVVGGRLEYPDTRIAVGDTKRALDRTITKHLQRFIHLCFDTIVETLDVSGRLLAAGIGAADDRGGHTHIRT